jgi:hypothetical protein
VFVRNFFLVDEKSVSYATAPFTSFLAKVLIKDKVYHYLVANRIGGLIDHLHLQYIKVAFECYRQQ